MKQISFVTHADLLRFYVGAKFRMEMLDGLLSHKLYPDNEITLSDFICAGGSFICIGHRVSQPETLPKALLRTKVTSSNLVIQCRCEYLYPKFT